MLCYNYSVLSSKGLNTQCRSLWRRNCAILFCLSLHKYVTVRYVVSARAHTLLTHLPTHIHAHAYILHTQTHAHTHTNSDTNSKACITYLNTQTQKWKIHSYLGLHRAYKGHISIHLYTYIHIYIHTYGQTEVHTYILTHIHPSIHTYIHT